MPQRDAVMPPLSTETSPKALLSRVPSAVFLSALLLPMVSGCVLISEDELAWRQADGKSAVESGTDGLTGLCDDGSEAAVWYADADGDGFGDPRGAERGCEQPSGTTDNHDDCDDSDASLNLSGEWHLDADGDGVGGNISLTACARPEGYVDSAGDCDDIDPLRFPGAVERCDGRDNDCDNLIDDADSDLDLTTGVTVYVDADGDGFGDLAGETQMCVMADGFADNGDDCDDNEALANPGLEEVCGDGIDNDCSADPSECVLDGQLSLSMAGVTYSSSRPFSSAGSAVLGGRDLTADGISDLVVTATSADFTDFENAGELYIVPGDAGVSGTVDLEAAAITTIQGDAPGDLFAGTLAYAGDLDGDGLDDMLAGAGFADLGGVDAGAVYLFSGSLSSGAHLASDAASAVVTGEDAGDFAGFSMAPLGDVNGDSYGDLAIGAYRRGTNSAGAVFLMHGPITGVQTTAAAALTVEGVPVDRAGYSVSGDSDLTGDGVPDLVFGADRASSAVVSRTGLAGVVSGAREGVLAVADADGLVFGVNRDASFGYELEPVGDVDGDGYDDLMVGSPTELGSNGAVYLFAGPITGVADANDAIVWFAGDPGDELGKALAAVPDANGDGTSELLLGARGSGRALLFYSPVSGGHTPSDASVELVGGSASKAGASVAAGGDFNDDGVDDLLIGQPGANSVTVVFGGAL